MADNKKRLFDAMARETAEFEKMATILNKKLEAVSNLNSAAVLNIVGEEFAELKKIQTVEKERAEILKELALSGADLNDLRVLEKKLGKEDSEVYGKLHRSLKHEFTRVQSLNGISRAVLKHSLAFIRQNISILTDGGNRKLVDRRA